MMVKIKMINYSKVSRVMGKMLDERIEDVRWKMEDGYQCLAESLNGKCELWVDDIRKFGWCTDRS